MVAAVKNRTRVSATVRSFMVVSYARGRVMLGSALCPRPSGAEPRHHTDASKKQRGIIHRSRLLWGRDIPPSSGGGRILERCRREVNTAGHRRLLGGERI